MTERKPLPRYWTPSEMQTWAAPEGGLVHMFPQGLSTYALAACGKSVMKRLEDEEYGPLEEWANGSPNRRELCTDCLDLWWNGPADRRDRMYEDQWVIARRPTSAATLHLNDVSQSAACGLFHMASGHVSMSAAMAQSDDPVVCHDCAVIWDTQQARRAGMDDSEGRGWGAAYGDGEKIHRFRTIELDATVELTYCTPHRVPRIEGSRATLEEFERLTPACPVCLVATDEAEAEVPEPVTAPLDLWGKGTGRLIHWVPVRRLDGALHTSACETGCARIAHVRPVEEYPSSSHPLFCGPCERLHAEAVDAYRAQVIKKAQEVRTVVKRVRKW